jgi:hypothetical protein
MFPPAPSPTGATPIPRMVSSAPTPSSPAAIPVMRRAPVSGSPSARPFTTPEDSSGDQIVMFAPFTSSRFRSRQLIRIPFTRGTSPMPMP